MATRQNLPKRITVGQTYNIQKPRETVRLGRKMTFVGPTRSAAYEGQSGALVCTHDSVADARQKPVIGSLVFLANSRHTRATAHTFPGGLQSPNVTATFNSRVLCVVTDISACSKFLLVRSLFTRPYSDHGTVPWEKSCVSRGSSQVSSVPLWTPNTEVFRLNDLRSCLGDGIPRLARVTYVKQWVSPSEINPDVIAELKRRAKQQIAEGLFTRLASLTPGAGRMYPGNNERRINKIKGQSHATVLATALKVLPPLMTDGHLEDLNGRLAGLMRDLQDQASRSLQEKGIHRRMDKGNLQGIVTDWAARRLGLTVSVAEGCNHWTERTTELWQGHGLLNYCSDCAERSTPALNRSGDTVHVHRATRVFEHDDGLTYTYPPAPIIRGRHSGKSVVGFIDPKRPDKYPTLGLELEMQAVDSYDRDLHAMNLRKRAAKVLDRDDLKKYLHFEEDSSTGPNGFEMVTGWTDLQTHAKILKEMLTDNGVNCWQGKLRSHNNVGGSCGIHVHIVKPSLIVSTKMRSFIYAAENKRLIEAVARRYNGSFSKMINVDSWQEQAVDGYRDAKRYVSSNALASKQAVSRLNGGDRYQALNFLNANTVEFRIFRGSMLYESVMACMEFTQSVYEFCRYTKAVNLNTPAFLKFICQPAQKHLTPNLRAYIRRKGFDVVVPNPVKAQAPAEAEAQI